MLSMRVDRDELLAVRMAVGDLRTRFQQLTDPIAAAAVALDPG